MTAPYDPEHITYFAETDYRNQRKRFGIKSRDRTRHMYVIGKSGVGKSTLLENMAIQDIQNGEGCAILDPHGSFAEKMLDYVPEHRIKDVIYFAPFDSEYPISFNVLEDVGPEKRHLVVSGLMSTFKKIWVDAWSARMEYILSNTLLALLEYPDSTLLGVNRMLSDKDFRKKVVDNISDSAVKAFWTEEFAKYTERMAAEAVPAIQNKIGQLTANPLIRNIIGQPKSSFDIRKVMDEQKILIINLSKGRIGEQNTSLLGSMIITKIYLGAMSRADASPQRMAELPNFYFYVDEFQSFANETFAGILSEARKYKLALIIAHQYVAQMEESVRDAVFGNVGTSVSFRVGALDGELLEKVFAPQFTQNDLLNLGMAQIYLSLMINDMGSPPFSARTLPPVPRPAISYRNDVIEWTRSAYAAPKASVEKDTRDWFALDAVPHEDKPRKTTRFAPEEHQQSIQHGNKYEGQGSPHYPSKYQSRPPQEGPREWQKRPYEKPISTPAMQAHTSFSTTHQEKIPERHAPFKEALATIEVPEKREPPLAPPQKALDQQLQQKPSEKPLQKIEQKTEKEPPLSPSPGLTALLGSLSFEEKERGIVQQTEPQKTHTPFEVLRTISPSPHSSLDTTSEKREVEKAPFVGEQPLRNNSTPVKHAERGPTEKNRDLLKAALQAALVSSGPKNIPENMPEKSPVVSPENTTVTSTEPSLEKTPPHALSSSGVPYSAPHASPPPLSPSTPSDTRTTEIPFQELRKVLE